MGNILSFPSPFPISKPPNRPGDAYGKKENSCRGEPFKLCLLSALNVTSNQENVVLRNCCPVFT